MLATNGGNKEKTLEGHTQQERKTGLFLARLHSQGGTSVMLLIGPDSIPTFTSTTKWDGTVEYAAV